MTHKIVAGLGYGDEGKGSITDYLCSPHVTDPAKLVVRFNGGAQAAHNVVLPDGRHHTFAQFGSGTLQGARTHLSRFMLVNPLNMMREAERLKEIGIDDPWSMITIDPRALVITPYHIEVNRALERSRGDERHGSTGQGIWETVSLALTHPDTAIRVGDLGDNAVLGKLIAIKATLETKRGVRIPALGHFHAAVEYHDFASRVQLAEDADVLGPALKEAPAVFEGAQGVLIDKDHGCKPYVTGSTTTFANALELLAEVGQQALKIGVTRTYMTRHGPGPFPTERKSLSFFLPEEHNKVGTWQGEFRAGNMDAVALRYSLDVCGGADMIALTHMDTLTVHPELSFMCIDYGLNFPEDSTIWERAKQHDYHWKDCPSREFPGVLGEQLGCLVGILSAGPSCMWKYLPEPGTV